MGDRAARCLRSGPPSTCGASSIGEGLVALSGLLSGVLGLFLLWAPGAGVLAMLWWIGSLAIVVGILTIALGFRFRSVTTRLPV